MDNHELRQLYDQAVSGIRVVNTNFAVISINQTLLNMLAISEKEALNKKCYDDCYSKLCHTSECVLKQIMNGAEAVEASVESTCLDGIKTTYLSTSKPLRNSAGQIIGMSQDFRDISELKLSVEKREKETAEALHKSETYNNLILDGINEVVALYEVIDGGHYKFLKVNNNLLKTLAMKEQAVLGKLIQDVVPANIAKVWIKNNRKVVKSRKQAYFEDDYGDLGVFDVKLFPILDKEGQCTHIICSTNNITEQKKMEDHQLKIQKLESVGLLAGGIAHDFNNILTAIIGNTSLARMKVEQILSDKDKAKLANWLLEIERASHQAKDLIQQLLTFAKGGNPILNTMEIGSLLTETIDFALRGSNVRCNYLIVPGLWSVEIDEGQMSQVIHNLVVNANHAMLGGGIITVTAQNVVLSKADHLPLPKGEYVKISIQDQGQGIAEEHLNKIFDPYFSTKQMGNGLGLTTTYSVVRKHKGYITVESKVGLGTTFHIFLPASQKKVRLKSQWLQTSLIGKGKVLVMDDERIIRHVLKDMLAMLGYEAVCVDDGYEAVAMYTKALGTSRPFDLVIMDLTIPGGLGGKDTINKLLEIDPTVKAIVSSGYSNDPVMASYKQYGFLGVVTKPYNVERLSEALTKVEKISCKHRKVQSIS